MARESRRTPLTGSSFIRSLAALNGHQASASPDDFAQRVSQWLDWTHAFSLSAALNEAPGSTTPVGAGLRTAPGADEREVVRVRAALAKLVEEPAPATAETPTDFLPYRRRYAACQQAMDAQIGPLRRRVRASLAARSSAMAKLAALDQVMEPVVGAHERALLSTVASLLEPRFEHLRKTHGEPSRPDAWLLIFHRDMRALLLAELDLRLQPVEGLLAAGRTSFSDHA